MTAKTYNEYIIVTDWERVSEDDFYLTDKDWAKNVDPDSLQNAKELQKTGHLYIGYIVPAVHYAIYDQMYADQVFIDEDGDEVVSCESAIIGDKHQKCFEFSY